MQHTLAVCQAPNKRVSRLFKLVLVLIWIRTLRTIKKPFKESWLKVFLTVAVIFVSGEWWRNTISMQHIHYDFGCYVETKCHRRCTALFEKENGKIEG